MAIEDDLEATLHFGEKVRGHQLTAEDVASSLSTLNAVDRAKTIANFENNLSAVMSPREAARAEFYLRPMRAIDARLRKINR